MVNRLRLLVDAARREAEALDPDRLERGAILYIQTKLFVSLTGFAIFASLLSPAVELIPILGVFAAVDSLFLIPYYFLVKRGRFAAITAGYISLAISTIAMTVGLHLSGNFLQPMVFAYFILFPLATLAVPHPPASGVVALMATVAYVTLVVAELSGSAPMVNAQAPHLAQRWLLYAAGIILGFWATAAFTARQVAKNEQQRKEKHLLYAEAQRRAEAEAAWSTVGKTVISTQNLDQVLTTVIQVINEKMQVETGTVLLRERGTDEIVFAKVLRGNTEQLSSIRLKLGQGVVGWVIARGEPALVNDPPNDPRWYRNVDLQTGFTTRSILCVPLMTGNQVIGAIELLNKLGGGFDQADLRLLESIAAPIAIAIQNAQLHEDLMKQLNSLTALFHQVEHAKREWETTVDAIDEGIVLVDDECRILRTNHTLADWLHTTSTHLVGQYCYRVIHACDTPPEQCPHAKLVKDRDFAHDAEIEEPRLGGIFHMTSYPLLERSGKFIGAVTVLKNVTTEKRLQEQLIRSEKLAATGQLAASLAHEINNPLQAIQGCLDLAQANPTDAAKQQRYLTMAKGELDRLTAMVQRMLDLYRPAKGVVAPVNVQMILDDVLTLTAKRLQHAKVIVHTEWDPSVPTISAVANQLKQVFLNLVLNAAEAMPKGGTLNIRGRMMEEEGHWVTLDFADSGVGIPPDDLGRIFEPFYTTKADGTGLGLGVSQKIVTSHGGKLTVTSKLNEGSTFTIWLPIKVQARKKRLQTYVTHPS